jgi:periplasmic protein TonB
MFDELVESNVVAKKTNKSWTIFVSTAVQSLIVGVLVLIPLIYTEALPRAMMATLLVAPPPPPPPPPPPQVVEVKIVKPVARLLTQGRLMQPRAIPKNVVVFREAELPPEVPVAGVFGGVDSLLGGLGEGATGVAPPPPPVRITRTKVGGNVQEARIIARPNPVYPALARQARIQGKVQLHAIIDKEGRVAELQVVSGHPLLVRAALDAVQNWRYQPTILNGEPVEVDTTIDVNFVLGG